MPQPGLLPDVMSLSAATPLEYRSGLRKPSCFWPALRSWSLRSATTDANVGLEQLVPSTPCSCPATSITNCTPWVDTSGYPRPDTLQRPLDVLADCRVLVCRPCPVIGKASAGEVGSLLGEVGRGCCDGRNAATPLGTESSDRVAQVAAIQRREQNRIVRLTEPSSATRSSHCLYT